MSIVPILILAISALFQFAAAFFAFRLVKLTGKIYSWILISAALCLIGFRRLVPVFYLIFMPEKPAQDPGYELLGLVLSVLLFFGVIGIRPILTGYKRKEDEIRKQERRFRSTLDSMLEGCQIIGFDWRYLYLNDTAGIHNRRPKEEFLGKKYTDMWPGIKNTEIYRIIKRCMEERISTRLENDFIFPDGTNGCFELSVQPVPEGVFILSIDITGRKRTEDAMCRSEEKFSVLFNKGSLPAVLSRFPDHRIIDVNGAWLQLFGFTKEEAIGKTSIELGINRDPENRAHIINELHARNNIQNLERTLYSKSGSVLTVLTNISVVTIGGQQYAFHSMQDITERKRTEEALQASYRFLQIAYSYPELPSLLEEFVREVKNYTGCKAAGIRILDQDGNIPYHAYNGFSRSFFEMESPLSIKSDKCMCINVIKGTVDPSLPFYTAGGSFYMNGTTRFLATVSEEDKGQTRNVCNQTGYESVALIPVRLKGRILGLIHVADTREDMVPLSTVEILEKAGMQLGTAILRRQAENALRRSEEALKDREAKLNKAQMVANVGSWVWHIQSDRLEWSDQMFRIFGIDKETFTGDLADVISRAIHPEDREAVEKVNLSVIENKKPVPLEYRIVWPDGTERVVWAEAGELILDGNGNPVVLTGIVQDITERKGVEEELKKYHEHLEDIVRQRTDELTRGRNMLRTLIDTLPDEIYAKDNECRFIMANHRVLNTFGLSDFRDILGKSDFDILPGEEAFKENAMERSLLQPNGQMVNYEENVTGRDGKAHWLSVTKVPLHDREGNITGLVGINRDISYFKESEENLKKSKEAAEAANLAKSIFLSGMSHEIRTPLNAILGFSQLMQADDTLSEEHFKWLEIINRSGEHLLALINDILEISRIEAGRIAFNPSGFDLFDLLDDIEAMFKLKAEEKNLAFIFESSGEVPGYISTDEGKLRQIIINLVGNAVKFTKEGGVALRVKLKDEGNKLYLVLDVEDTGPGISLKDIAKLFQKFGQTETGIKEGGTGLGLAISRQYARVMGGEITVKSEEKKGTCFTLVIPVETAEKPVKNPESASRVAGLKPGRKIFKVLIVDDRSDNRELLKVILSSVGFEVTEAQNGIEAIEKFKEFPPDLVLMDIRMPAINGYEAIRGIRAIENKRTPIIAVTASAFQEDRNKIREAGADGYLRKPFRERELFDCIQSCLDIQYIYK